MNKNQYEKSVSILDKKIQKFEQIYMNSPMNLRNQNIHPLNKENKIRLGQEQKGVLLASPYQSRNVLASRQMSLSPNARTSNNTIIQQREQQTKLQTIVICGMNCSKAYNYSNPVYIELRRKVIQDFLILSENQYELFQEFQSDRQQRRGYAIVKYDDPKKNFAEIQYQRQQDVDKALEMNMKQYKLQNLRFTIVVQLKDKLDQLEQSYMQQPINQNETIFRKQYIDRIPFDTYENEIIMEDDYQDKKPIMQHLYQLRDLFSELINVE